MCSHLGVVFTLREQTSTNCPQNIYRKVLSYVIVVCKNIVKCNLAVDEEVSHFLTKISARALMCKGLSDFQ